MQRSFYSTVCVGAASVLGLAGCRDKAEPSTPSATATVQPADSAGPQIRELKLSADAIKHGGVQWTAAAQQQMAGSIEVPGQLAANEDRTARLGAPAQARVLTVHVQVGDRVARDQTLVTLQSGEANTARADYNKALADLAARRAAATYARAARERAERLLAAKAIARQEVERATADDELAKSEVTRAESEVGRTQGMLQQLGAGTDGSMVIRSPIEGIVLSRDASPGAVVQAGAPLVAVSDPTTLWLDVAVADRVASTLRTSMQVRFAVPALPTDTFNARVLNVGGALDAATRTLPVRALVENGGRKLRAQMFATVWLPGGDSRPAIAVPEGAVMLLDEKPVVFVAHPEKDGSVRFERRNVSVGGTSGRMVQILSGLQPGDLVVTEGAYALKSEFSRSKMAGG